MVTALWSPGQYQSFSLLPFFLSLFFLAIKKEIHFSFAKHWRNLVRGEHVYHSCRGFGQSRSFLRTTVSGTVRTVFTFYFIFWIKEVMKWLGNLGNSIVLGLDLVVSLLSLSFLFIVLLFYYRSVFHMEENNLRA